METIKRCVVAFALALTACQTGVDEGGEHYAAKVEALGACVVPVSLTALDLYADGEGVIASTVGDAAITWQRTGDVLWLSPATLELGKWYTSPVMVQDGKAEIAIADLHGFSCMYRVTFTR